MEVVYDRKKITTSQFNYCFPSSSSARFYQRLFVLHRQREGKTLNDARLHTRIPSLQAYLRFCLSKAELMFHES